MPRGRSLNVAAGSVSSFRWGTRLRPIPSAASDASALASLAASRSFDTVTLIDREARFDAVRHEISRAAADLSAGDTFVLTFSGHGLAGKRRGIFQQSWCLHDDPLMRFGDDGLDAMLAAFAPGVRIFVVANCCHSGAPDGPTPLTPNVRAHLVRLNACGIGYTTNGSETATESPFVSRIMDAASSTGNFDSFFRALVSSSNGSKPQLEVPEPRDDRFLSDGPFRVGYTLAE